MCLVGGMQWAEIAERRAIFVEREEEWSASATAYHQETYELTTGASRSKLQRMKEQLVQQLEEEEAREHGQADLVPLGKASVQDRMQQIRALQHKYYAASRTQFHQ